MSLSDDMMHRGNLPRLMEEIHFARFLMLTEEDAWLDGTDGITKTGGAQ